MNNFLNPFCYREYKELQGVPWGKRELHRVTRGYRVLQGVRVAYRGLHGVTRSYSGLQKVTGVTRDGRLITVEVKARTKGMKYSKVLNSSNGTHFGEHQRL